MDQRTPTAVPPLNESDLRLLRIFRSVAEAGGLTAAEAALGMERSTISRHLQTLEIRLGARLCFRGPGGFELTDFGQRALQAAVSACDTLDLIRHELNLARNVMTGDLHLGIADNCLTNAESAFGPALAKFREHAPDVNVHLSIKLPNDLLSGVAERHFHLGITGATPGHEKLEFRPIFHEDFRLYTVARDGAPAPRLEDLARNGYAVVMRTNDQRTQMMARKLKLQRNAVAFGLEAVATLLAAGGFVGYLPRHYAQALSHIHSFVEVQGSEQLAYDTIFSLVWLKDRALPPSAQLLVRLLLDMQAAKADAALRSA